jgi:hypothetical protein
LLEIKLDILENNSRKNRKKLKITTKIVFFGKVGAKRNGAMFDYILTAQLE